MPMSLHMAGQHFEHIVFGANQRACWLRCTLCEKTSRRVIYRYIICMKCPGRRREDYELLWETSTRCVLIKWNCLLLRLFWMGTEDMRTYFAQEIRDLHQHRQFVDVDDSEMMEVFHEITERDPRTSDDLRAEVSLLKNEQEDTLDETRIKEIHRDPYNTQGSCPSKPFEGLEQCLPWHHRAWDMLSRGYSCHRRRT